MRQRIKKEKPDTILKHAEETHKSGITKKMNDDSSVVSSVMIFVAVVTTAAVVIGIILHQMHSFHEEQLKILERATSAQQAVPQQTIAPSYRPTAIVWSPRVKMTHLRHVFRVLERLGYNVVENNASKWDVLWTHDYPFHVWKDVLKSLTPHQKVNHFPGTGYVTTKVTLATSGGLYIPPAFKIPDDKDKLLEYVEAHPDVKFVEKNNDHRSVQLRALNEIDLEASRGSFLQEFVSRPFLISGHKFDIGVYTIVTSVDPLRIYKYDGDVLFRFCLEAYEPFNASNTAQYVIGEDYLPAWQVPAMKIYTDLGYSRRDAFDAHLRSIGKDPAIIWRQVDEAISAIYLRKEKLFSDLLLGYRSRRSFFEMVRFDFIIDDDLRVYLLEANMSPNLSSMHYPPNALLYEQVLYSLLSLVGVSSYMQPPLNPNVHRAARDMVAAELNLMVFPEKCAACENCEMTHCQLCKPCLNAATLADFRQAYLEHLNRNRCKRIFPPSMTQEEARRGQFLSSNLTKKNELMVLWFRGKCLLDNSWCQ